MRLSISSFFPYVALPLGLVLVSCSGDSQTPDNHVYKAVPTHGVLLIPVGSPDIDHLGLNAGRWLLAGSTGVVTKSDSSVVFEWQGIRPLIDMSTGPYGWVTTRPDGSWADIMWDYQSQQWIVQATVTVRIVDPVNPAVWVDAETVIT